MGSEPWNFPDGLLTADKKLSLIASRQPSQKTPKLFEVFGGGKRDRTDDLLHAMQALSQLSYTPSGLGRLRRIKDSLAIVEPLIIARKITVYQGTGWL